MASNRLENLEMPSNSPGLEVQTIGLLNERFLRIAEKLKLSLTSSGGVLVATHVERIGQAIYQAASLTSGTQFWETDRKSVV